LAVDFAFSSISNYFKATNALSCRADAVAQSLVRCR
jgi:hypothetical protein